MFDEFNEIEAKYFDLTEDKISIREFENWVYESNWLEDELSKDEYLELISLNFTTPSVKYEVGKILKNHIDDGKFEKLRFLNILNSIINRDGNEGESLAKTYDLYCHGYYFLQDLGLGIGLEINVPHSYGADYYDELSENQKKQLVDKVYPTAKELAEELKNWTINGELILTGEIDEDFNRLQYIDNRSDEDKKSRVWKAVDEKSSEVKSMKNRLLDKFGDFVEKLKP